MTDFNLDAFLAAQQSQGVSQGQGDFTISHEKARSKMTRYSLPREHSWVLKLVQAAVGWGCTKINLCQTRTESTFWFQTEDFDALPTNDQLITALLRSDFDSPKPLDRFGTALRLVVERAHLSFQLQVDRGKDEAEAIYAGVFFTEIGEQRRERLRENWGCGVTLMIHHISHTEPNRFLLSFLPVKTHSLPLLQELEKFAYVSPVPIKVDGRWLDGPLRSSQLNWCYHRKPLRIDGVPVQGLPELRLSEGFGDRTFTVKTSSRRAFRKPFDKKQAPVYLILGLEIEGGPYELQEMELRSCIHWVCDGVVVQTERPLATKNVIVHVYANAGGLKTDLTSFHLVENEAFLERRRRIFGAVARYLFAELGLDRDIFAEDNDERSQNDDLIEYRELKQKRRGLAVRLALGSVALAPLTGPVAPGTLLTGLAASAYVATRKVARREVSWEDNLVVKRYRKEIEALAERFAHLATGSQAPRQDQEEN